MSDTLRGLMDAAEDREEHPAEDILWAPTKAGWHQQEAQARQPPIGQVMDDAIATVDPENPALESLLPKDCSLPAVCRKSNRIRNVTPWSGFSPKTSCSFRFPSHGTRQSCSANPLRTRNGLLARRP